MNDEPQQPLPIEYHSPRPIVTTGNSRVVRSSAAVVAVLLLALIGNFLLQSRHTFGGIRDWILPIAAAAGGAAYCLLIALDIAGRTRSDVLRRAKER